MQRRSIILLLFAIMLPSLHAENTPTRSQQIIEIARMQKKIIRLKRAADIEQQKGHRERARRILETIIPLEAKLAERKKELKVTEEELQSAMQDPTSDEISENLPEKTR